MSYAQQQGWQPRVTPKDLHRAVALIFGFEGVVEHGFDQGKIDIRRHKGLANAACKDEMKLSGTHLFVLHHLWNILG